jgi:hypothetical protein
MPTIQLQKSKIYKSWLIALKEQIQQSQIKAAIVVNKELLSLYWELGKEICEKETTSNWGDGLIEQLSIDLLKAFPEIKGFSRTNLFYIKKWYEFYTLPPVKNNSNHSLKRKPTKGIIVPQAVGQLQKNCLIMKKSHSLWDKFLGGIIEKLFLK